MWQIHFGSILPAYTELSGSYADYEERGINLHDNRHLLS